MNNQDASLELQLQLQNITLRTDLKIAKMDLIDMNINKIHDDIKKMMRSHGL